MKTAAYLIGLAAVLALLTLNLVESVRIRKALCGEYVTWQTSLFLSSSVRLAGRTLLGGRPRSGENSERTPLDHHARHAAGSPLLKRAPPDGVASARKGGKRPGYSEALHVLFEFGREAHSATM